MSNMKFTAGPWDFVTATEHHGYYIVDEVGTTICDLYTMTHPKLTSVLSGGTSEPVSFIDAEANAHLISAAPDLYEALVNTLGLVAIKYGNLHEDVNQIQLMALSALRKARGEA